MATLLDDLIAEQNRKGLRPASAAQLDPNSPIPEFITNANVDAIAEKRYGGSFFDQPSHWDAAFGPQNARQLREQVNLENLTTLAAQRRLELEQAQRRAPTQDALLEAQLEHQLASTAAIGSDKRFQLRKDAETMGHVSGFSDYLLEAPPVDSPQYAPYILQGVKKFPRVASTAWGKNVLGRIAQEHDTIAGLTSKIPLGFEVDSVTLGGKNPTVTAKSQDADIEGELKKGYGLTLGQVRNPVGAEVGKRVRSADGKSDEFVGDPKGNLVRIEDGEGKKITMSSAEYERYGGKFSPETIAARGGGQSASSANPDLLALAQKALDDPKATDAHKAAARKLLGK